MKVQFVRGRTLGSVEENFIARLRPGDHFTFAGRTLEFVRVRGMVAYVRKSPSKTLHRAALVGRPDADLARAGRRRSGPSSTRRGRASTAVRRWRRCVRSWSCRAAWSRLPAADELLIERVETREGHHLFFYPVEGRLVHEGLAALFAYRHRPARPDLLHPRRQRLRSRAADRPTRADRRGHRGRALSPAHLLHDIPASLNAAELARRQFREIARVAGLIFQGYPGVTQVGEAGAGLERAALRRLCPLRPGQPAAVPGAPRGAGAPAGAEPAGPRARPDRRRVA